MKKNELPLCCQLNPYHFYDIGEARIKAKCARCRLQICQDCNEKSRNELHWSGYHDQCA